MAGQLSFDQTFSVTIKILKLIGLPSCFDRYPNLGAGAVRSNAGFIVCFLALGYCVIGQIVYVWTEAGSGDDATFLEIANQIACTGFCAIGLLKMYVLAFHRDLLAEVIHEFRAGWNKQIQDPLNLEFSEKFIRPTMTVTHCAATINIAMVSCFNFLPIAEMVVASRQSQRPWHRQLPYKIWVPFDPLAGWVYYGNYLFHVYSGLIVAIGNVGFNCIFCLMSAHLSLQLKLLGRTLENVIPLTDGEPNKVAPENGWSNLADAVQRHQQLLGFKTSLETIFSATFFLIYAGASIIICFQGVMMTTSPGYYVLAKFAMFFLCVLLEIFFLCYYGDEVLQSSTDVGTAAYKCRWYHGSDGKLRKSLIPVIMRAQKPLVLMAWKFWPISINTFGMILNASWSYFTLLRAVYN